MKQEEKELLLKDLSTRLPYGVKCDVYGETRLLYSVSRDTIGFVKNICAMMVQSVTINRVKPYLRPMSSMTTEEDMELDHIVEKCGAYPMSEMGFKLAELISDFCNRHHLDFRGLIPKGLALEAPEGMYKAV